MRTRHPDGGYLLRCESDDGRNGSLGAGNHRRRARGLLIGLGRAAPQTLQAPRVHVRRSDHQPDPRRARCARHHLFASGARVSRSYRRVRRKGPGPARHHQRQPRALQMAEMMDRIAAGARGAAAALHSDHPEGQLRHRRHADDRRLGDAGAVGAAGRCVRGEAVQGGGRDHPRRRPISPSWR